MVSLIHNNFARHETSLVLFESWYPIGVRVYETCLALAFFIRPSLKSEQYCALALNYHLFLHQHGNKPLFRKGMTKRAKYVFFTVQKVCRGIWYRSLF